MIRITTSGVLRNYKSSLMRSSSNLYSAQNKVLTQRNFNHYAEDPAAATQAFKLRRLHSRTGDQITNNTSLLTKFQSAWSSVSTVKKLVEDGVNDAALRAVNDPTASGRQPLGEVLSSSAKSIVQSLNIQYADSFIFAGSNADTPPFSWSESGGLMYQGVSVDAGGIGTRPEGTPPNPSEPSISSAWSTYYGDNPEFAKLVTATYETTYIDIGAGLSEDSSGQINRESAFNAAISGIDILGYGLDADGDPKNAVSIMTKLSEIFGRCDASSGAYASDEDQKMASRLTEKLQGSLAALTNKWTSMDGQCQYLTSNKERLVDTGDELNEQILSLEQADLADAITEFSWAQYCYNSALKVGNSILSQSLIDYMN